MRQNKKMKRRNRLDDIAELTGHDGVCTSTDKLAFASVFSDLITPENPPPIVAWTEENIDLALDKDSAYKGKLVLRPWQRAALLEYEKPEVEELDIMSCSRAGKSILAISTTLYNLRYYAVPVGLMRETLDFARDAWRHNIRPVAAMVDGLSSYVDSKHFRADCWQLPKSSLRLLGGGTILTGRTLCRVVGDEIDRYMCHEGELPNWMHLGRRTVTWSNRKVLYMSTPTSDGVNTIYGRWKESSKGKWHISCLHCGHLWDASNFGNIQAETGKQVGLSWSKDSTGEVIPDSVCWVCPRCYHVHHWEDAERMNELGRFVHAAPSIANRRGLQIGGLAVYYLADKSWLEIARRQENSGKNAPRERRQEFANEYRGLPWVDKRVGETEKEDILLSRVRMPDANWKPVAIIASADTQQASGCKYWLTSIWGIDNTGTMHLLDARAFNDISDLERVWCKDGRWKGLPLSLGVIDVRGFASNENDVKPLITRNRGKLLGWQGSGYNSNILNVEGWEPSKSPGIINANDKHYQSLALDALYITGRAEEVWFCDSLPDEFFEHLKNMSQPKDWQTDFSQWKPNSGRIDWFDVCKMAIAAREWISDPRLFPVAKWQGRVPEFVHRRVRLMLEKRKTTPNRPAG